MTFDSVSYKKSCAVQYRIQFRRHCGFSHERFRDLSARSSRGTSRRRRSRGETTICIFGFIERGIMLQQQLRHNCECFFFIFLLSDSPFSRDAFHRSRVMGPADTAGLCGLLARGVSKRTFPNVESASRAASVPDSRSRGTWGRRR